MEAAGQVKPLPPNESGYVARDGVMYATVEDFLVAETRERYADGEIEIEDLPARVEAALRGDWRACGFRFLPFRAEYVYR